MDENDQVRSFPKIWFSLNNRTPKHRRKANATNHMLRRTKEGEIGASVRIHESSQGAARFGFPLALVTSIALLVPLYAQTPEKTEPPSMPAPVVPAQKEETEKAPEENVILPDSLPPLPPDVPKPSPVPRFRYQPNPPPLERTQTLAPQESPAPVEITSTTQSIFAQPEQPFAPNRAVQTLSPSDALTDGLGGLPSGLFFNQPSGPSLGSEAISIGPIAVRPTLGLSALWTKTTGTPGGLNDTEESEWALNTRLQAELDNVAAGRGIAFTHAASIRLDDINLGDADQQLSLDARYRFNRLGFRARVDFAKLGGQSRDAGTNLERELTTVELATAYQLSQKTSLLWEVSLPKERVADGISTEGFTSSHYVMYQYSTKTMVGIGYTWGQTDVDFSETQHIQRPGLRFAYKPSTHFEANCDVGYEFRKIGDFSEETPTFSVGLLWRPRERTTMSLSANRQANSSSSTVASNFNSTLVSLNFSQAIGDRFTASIGLAYERSAYYVAGSTLNLGEATFEGVSLGTVTLDQPAMDRLDNLYSAQASFGVNFRNGLTCSLSAAYSENDSNSQPFKTIRLACLASFAF